MITPVGGSSGGMAMALQAASIAARARPSVLMLSQKSGSSSSSCRIISKKNQAKLISLWLPTSSAISVLTLLSSPQDAKAFSIPREPLLDSLNKFETAIEQAGEVVSNVLDVTGKASRVFVDTVKPGVDVAVPILQKAGDEALKLASPAVSDASKQAQKAFESAGLDPQPVLSAAKTVIDVAQQTPKVLEDAKPIASATVETLSSDPGVIVVTSGALLLAYLLLPSVWSAITFNFRGYRGDLTAAQSLDLIGTQGYLIIDIRSERDKYKAGIPRLPSNVKNNLITIPLEELPSKIRGLVRNSKRVESEIAAIKISYLKRVSKGTNIVIMDSYCDTAKTVARTLTRLGFKNSWIMVDGFSGNRGWLQSRLGTDSYNAMFPEIISPSRIIPSAARTFGTTKLLSGGTNE